eukprot:TRINITY_DN29965_c0_g1_i1.p1 TRINITY_DN29965_c0_g1~~TRINITY_DN29965_c0_g1_i1.p1  ORF type:complete len:1487 (-),score=221.85 TRINITY_DN29965_c0_g1_i1:276-4736(-)
MSVCAGGFTAGFVVISRRVVVLLVACSRLSRSEIRSDGRPEETRTDRRGSIASSARTLEAWVEDICLEILVCKVDGNIDVHGASPDDGFEAFRLSLAHVSHTGGDGDSPPSVHNVCAGHRVADFSEVFALKKRRLREFVSSQADRRGFCLRVFVVMDATDEFFAQPPALLRERFWKLSDSGRKVVIASEMSCWVGRVCTAEDEASFFPNSTSSLTSSKYLNSGGMAGTPSALGKLLDFIDIPASECTDPWGPRDDQCDVARYARDVGLPEGLLVVDERQSIFGSLLVSLQRGLCPGDCKQGPHPFLCACLTCAHDKTWSCIGNAAMPPEELDKMFRLDARRCIVRRHLDLAGRDLHGPLEPLPVIWHGNGPGKVTFERLLPGLLTCLHKTRAQRQGAGSEGESGGFAARGVVAEGILPVMDGRGREGQSGDRARGPVVEMHGHGTARGGHASLKVGVGGALIISGIPFTEKLTVSFWEHILDPGSGHIVCGSGGGGVFFRRRGITDGRKASFRFGFVGGIGDSAAASTGNGGGSSGGDAVAPTVEASSAASAAPSPVDAFVDLPIATDAAVTPPATSAGATAAVVAADVAADTLSMDLPTLPGDSHLFGLICVRSGCQRKNVTLHVKTVRSWTHHAFIFDSGVVRWMVNGDLGLKFDTVGWNLPHGSAASILGSVARPGANAVMVDLVLGSRTSNGAGSAEYHGVATFGRALTDLQVNQLAGRRLEALAVDGTNRPVASPSAGQGHVTLEMFNWLTSQYRIWPPGLPPTSCEEGGVASSWGELRRFIYAYVEGISFESGMNVGQRFSYSKKALMAVQDMAVHQTKSFGELGAYDSLYSQCHIGWLCGQLVQMLVIAHKDMISAQLHDNVGCGILGVFHGFLSHVLFSGWPIFRLATLITRLTYNHGMGEPQLVAHYETMGSCRTGCKGRVIGARTLCQYYGFSDDSTCPLVRIREVLEAAVAAADTPAVLPHLAAIESEARRFMDVQQGKPTMERGNSFGMFERYVRHSLDVGHCVRQPYLFWDFAVAGIWDLFGRLEVSLARAAWVPAWGSGSDALLQVPFVDAVFGGTRIGESAFDKDLTLMCDKMRRKRDFVHDEAWATVLLSASPRGRLEEYAEAVRTLHFSVSCSSKFKRPFLVLTDGELPEDITLALAESGVEIRVVDTSKVAAAINAALPQNEESNWNIQRGLSGSAFAIKFYLWTLEPFRRVVFLDADTLVLDNIDELFSMPGGVFASDPVIHFQDSKSKGSSDVLNFGVFPLAPSRRVFNLIVEKLPTCKTLLGYYPLHDITDASFLDCVWRLVAVRGMRLARFGFDYEHLPPCEEVKKTGPCLMFSWRVSAPSERRVDDGIAFSGCEERDGLGFIPAIGFEGDTPFSRCSLPLMYAATVDFRSLFWLASFTFNHGWLKDRRFPTAEVAAAAISDAFIRGPTFNGIPKVLHWPTAGMKPWDHCGATRTAFDKLWWAMRGRMCATSLSPCRVACGSRV